MSFKIALIHDDVIQDELALNLSGDQDLLAMKKLKRMETELNFRSENHKLFTLLTRREREIIKLLSKGLSSLEIAEMLFISRYTVDQHRKNINRKLRVRSLGQLFHYALAFDLI